MILRLVIFGVIMLGLFAFGGYQYLQSLTPASQDLLDVAVEKIEENNLDDWVPPALSDKDNAVPPAVYDDSVKDSDPSVDQSQTATDPFPTPTNSQTFLTPAQRAALSAMGVDVSALPDTLTPELEACFIAAIGVERVQAIKAGEMPSMVEFLKAKKCLP